MLSASNEGKFDICVKNLRIQKRTEFIRFYSSNVMCGVGVVARLIR